MEEIEILTNRIIKARELIKNTDDLEEKYILNNYISELLEAIKDKLEIKVKTRRNHIFNNYNEYKKQIIIENKHISNFNDNYILNKDYLNDLLMDINDEVDPICTKLLTTLDINYKILNKEDILEILYLFFNSINNVDLLDKYIKENRIHELIIKNNNLKGFNIYNNVNKENDIFIRKEDCTINTLFVLVHELGHAYDFKNLSCKSNEYNKYMFESMYTETIPKLFEKLLLNYMINNNILKEDSINKLKELEIINGEFINLSYIFSNLEDEDILDNNYKSMNPNEICENIGSYIEPDRVIYYLMNWGNIDLKDNLSYAIGDIISMYIKDEGLDSKIFRDFMKIRTSIFNNIFFENNNINADTYIKKYKKELQLIKK